MQLDSVENNYNISETNGRDQTSLSANSNESKTSPRQQSNNPSQATSRPSGGERSGGPEGSGDEGLSLGGLKTALEDAVSPAFGATIIILITVVVSGSAYLCFLKYVCAGCCKPTQVAPTLTSDPNKVEEQV
ncbi:unnamed protein product [Arctogadus glacialis]